MHLQDTRVAALLVVGGCAVVHGAGDVGGTAVKLCPRVHQQQRVGVHCSARARLGPVVDDSAVRASTCAGVARSSAQGMARFLLLLTAHCKRGWGGT